MPKKQNGFLKSKKLLFLLPILLFALVGSYFIFTSEAITHRPYQLAHEAKYGNSNYVVPKSGDPAKVNILLATGKGPETTVSMDVPAFQAISVFSFDTKYYKYINGKCEWKYGCRISSMDTSTLPPIEWGVDTDLHKTRVAICFNVPANLNVYPVEVAFTHNLQRTSYMPGVWKPWFIYRNYSAEGACESNPKASGYERSDGTNGCAVKWGYPCDENTDPNVNCTNFIGVSNCVGNGPGNGNGTGGTGTGNNGQGSGSGPGPGSSGGGGSSATTQAEQPNSTPTSSPQGANEQTDLEPSPFFDGKEFEKGSDPATLANTVRSTSKKIVSTWPIVVGVILLGGAAGFGIWRWNNQRNGQG